MILLVAISNSSPLVFLSKIPKLLAIAEKFYKKIIVPEEVYNEIVGKGLKSKDIEIKENALKISNLIEEGFLVKIGLKGKWVRLKGKLKEDLGEGESASIALALQEKITEVLIDDKKGTVVAMEFKLQPKPISILPIIAFREKIIPKKEALELLDELLINNYYLGSGEYKKIVSLLK